MNTAELIPLKFDKIIQTNSYTVVVLSSSDTRFAIYTDATIGTNLQMNLMGSKKSRPLTHDLIDLFFKGLNVKIKQIIINELHDTVYYARIIIEQKINDQINIVEVDARPSDCITLALTNDVPIFCSKQVLENTVALEDDFYV